jgi:predicted membrane-bound spermidine synthase
MLYLALTPQGWETLVLIAVLGLLCCGLFTPAVCVVAALVVVFHLPHEIDLQTLNLSLLIAITAALAILGPGAYSVDSRLFGRRLLAPAFESLAIDEESKRH